MDEINEDTDDLAVLITDFDDDDDDEEEDDDELLSSSELSNKACIES